MRWQLDRATQLLEEELLNQKKTYERKCDDLSMEIVELQSSNIRLSNEANRLRVAVMSISDEKDIAVRDFDQLSIRFASISEREKMLTGAVSEMKKTILLSDQVRCEFETKLKEKHFLLEESLLREKKSENEISLLNSRMRQVEEENFKLQIEIKELKNRPSIVTPASPPILHFMPTPTQQTPNINVNASTDNTATHNSRLEEQLRTATNDKKLLEDEIRDLNDRLRTSKKQQAALEEENERLHRQLRQASKGDSQRPSDLIRLSIEENNIEDLDDFRERIMNMKRELNKEKLKTGELQEDLWLKEREIESLKAKIQLRSGAQTTPPKEEEESNESEEEEKNAETTAYQQRLGALEKKNAKLTNKVHALESVNHQLEVSGLLGRTLIPILCKYSERRRSLQWAFARIVIQAAREMLLDETHQQEETAETKKKLEPPVPEKKECEASQNEFPECLRLGLVAGGIGGAWLEITPRTPHDSHPLLQSNMRTTTRIVAVADNHHADYMEELTATPPFPTAGLKMRTVRTSDTNVRILQHLPGTLPPKLRVREGSVVLPSAIEKRNQPANYYGIVHENDPEEENEIENGAWSDPPLQALSQIAVSDVDARGSKLAVEFAPPPHNPELDVDPVAAANKESISDEAIPLAVTFVGGVGDKWAVKLRLTAATPFATEVEDMAAESIQRDRRRILMMKAFTGFLLALVRSGIRKQSVLTKSQTYIDLEIQNDSRNDVDSSFAISPFDQALRKTTMSVARLGEWNNSTPSPPPANQFPLAVQLPSPRDTTARALLTFRHRVLLCLLDIFPMTNSLRNAESPIKLSDALFRGCGVGGRALHAALFLFQNIRPHSLVDHDAALQSLALEVPHDAIMKDELLRVAALHEANNVDNEGVMNSQLVVKEMSTAILESLPLYLRNHKSRLANSLASKVRRAVDTARSYNLKSTMHALRGGRIGGQKEFGVAENEVKKIVDSFSDPIHNLNENQNILKPTSVFNSNRKQILNDITHGLWTEHINLPEQPAVWTPASKLKWSLGAVHALQDAIPIGGGWVRMEGFIKAALALAPSIVSTPEARHAFEQVVLDCLTIVASMWRLECSEKL